MLVCGLYAIGEYCPLCLHEHSGMVKIAKRYGSYDLTSSGLTVTSALSRPRSGELRPVAANWRVQGFGAGIMQGLDMILAGHALDADQPAPGVSTSSSLSREWLSDDGMYAMRHV
jgi:hypothetical protein